MFLPFFDTFIGFCGNGMVTAMLEPYMKNYANGTQTDVAVALLLVGLVYMITSPLTGLVCELQKKSCYFDNQRTRLLVMRSNQVQGNGVLVWKHCLDHCILVHWTRAFHQHGAHCSTDSRNGCHGGLWLFFGHCVYIWSVPRGCIEPRLQRRHFDVFDDFR